MKEIIFAEDDLQYQNKAFYMSDIFLWHTVTDSRYLFTNYDYNNYYCSET